MDRREKAKSLAAQRGWRRRHSSESKRRCVSSHRISPPNLSLVHHDCTIQQLLPPKKPETKRPNLKPGRHRLTMWRASASKRRCVSSNGVSSAEFISESCFEPSPQATETRARNATPCADDASSESKRRCVSSHRISPPNLSLVHHDCTIQQLLQPKKPETRRPNLKPGQHRLTMWRASARSGDVSHQTESAPPNLSLSHPLSHRHRPQKLEPEMPHHVQMMQAQKVSGDVSHHIASARRIYL